MYVWLLYLLSNLALDAFQCLFQGSGRLLQRQTFQTMGQRHRGNSVHMLGSNLRLTEIGGIGLSRASHHYIAAMAVNIQFNIDQRDKFSNLTRDRDRRQYARGLDNACTQLLFGSSVLGKKGLRSKL